MENLQDLIGFMEHLKSLNKTKIEIDFVLTLLLKIDKELLIQRVSNSVNCNHKDRNIIITTEGIDIYCNDCKKKL